MSSLNDVFDQMRAFERALVEFNQEIHISATALAQSHQKVSALWRDDAAQRYQQTYQPLAQSLDGYLRGGAPQFESFLETKLRQLEHYLRES